MSRRSSSNFMIYWIIYSYRVVIICSDFNCPGSEVLDDRLDDVLLTYNLKQHIQVSTHELGHVLDLIITRNDVIDLSSNYSLIAMHL